MLKHKVTFPYQLRREAKSNARVTASQLKEKGEEQKQQRLLNLVTFQNQVTSQVSLICRIINIGILTTMFSVALSNNKGIETLVSCCLPLLVFISFVSAFSLLCDYFHYVFNHKTVKMAIEHKDYFFEANSVYYQSANMCFEVKQMLALMSSCLFLLFICCYFVMLMNKQF